MNHPLPLFDDTYTGDRWQYGLTYRPFTGAGVPKGFIVYSDRCHADFRFGTIEYPFALATAQVKQMDLTDLGQVSS